MMVFDQERMNELQLYVNEGPAAEAGFKTILTGAAHPPYGAFVPAPGHQLGFNDLKVIEAAELLRAVAGGGRAWPDFARGAGVRAGDPRHRPLGRGRGCGWRWGEGGRGGVRMRTLGQVIGFAWYSVRILTALSWLPVLRGHGPT